MKRTSEQRRQYAWKRLSHAVDRQITSCGEAKEMARRWAAAWGKRAGFHG